MSANCSPLPTVVTYVNMYCGTYRSLRTALTPYQKFWIDSWCQGLIDLSEVSAFSDVGILKEKGLVTLE